jgi:hypothetical protein
MPVCFVQGAVSAVGDGSKIDVKVRLLWPLPLLFMWWVAMYANGLRDRAFGSEDLGILPIAVFFWGLCAYFVVGVIRGSIQEVRRIAMAGSEAESRRA